MTTPRWFFGNLVQPRVSREQTGGRFSILEITGPPGDSPPLHVHHDEDEAFTILEGSARLHVGSEVHDLTAGESILAPKGIPHTYVAGDDGARWLVTTSPGDFERFVLAVSRPAEAEHLPPAPTGPPSAEEIERVNRVAAEHGIEILGPPGALPS